MSAVDLSCCNWFTAGGLPNYWNWKPNLSTGLHWFRHCRLLKESLINFRDVSLVSWYSHHGFRVLVRDLAAFNRSIDIVMLLLATFNSKTLCGLVRLLEWFQRTVITEIPLIAGSFISTKTRLLSCLLPLNTRNICDSLLLLWLHDENARPHH